MRILVVGSGAREHALLWKLRRSSQVSELFVTPGNAGMESLATRLAIDEVPDMKSAYADLAEAHDVDLTIVGPEYLLVDGLVDVFTDRGLKVFGPTAAAAQLEGSKIWAKEVMQRVGIPTASWRPFWSAEDARAHAETLDWRCVIKSDGLASGKGSFVCRSVDDVHLALEVLLVQKRFGDKPILVEELLDGQEVSVFAISDGRTVVPFGAAQDHKRARDNDRGPNTGGMGAYSPVNHMQVAQDFAESFFKPIVTELAALGTPYVGVLYAGAIVTQQGPKILEFNCRFGDPEAEVLLCRLDDDLAGILWAATVGELHRVSLPTFSSQEALCVVISTERYPDEGDIGTPIYGVDEAAAMPGVFVFHGGTDRDPDTGELVTHGGRILSVTGLGATLGAARRRAYEAVEKIQFAGKYFRSDIATKAMGDMWNAFRTEWRKPPQWETQMMHVSQEISSVAGDVERLRLARIGSPSDAELEHVLKRLYDIKLTLHPSHVSETERFGGARRVPAEILDSFNAEFDAMLDRMQSPENAAALHEALGARPGDFASPPPPAHGKRG